MTGQGLCYPCARQAELDDLPPREDILRYGGWRLVHAYNTSLLGWLVAVAERHVDPFSALNAGEAASLGPLVRAASAALTEELGGERTYVIVLGESVDHVHAHVVPRMSDLAEAQQGLGAFALLDRPETEWISEAERDRIALALRPRIQGLLN